MTAIASPRASRAALVTAFIVTLIAGVRVAASAHPDDDAAVDLSPSRWDAGERARLERLRLDWGGARPLAEGGGGMVVGTSGPLAVRAGIDALEQGGTAADAAIATALAQIALTGGSWNSYAGIFGLVYYDAKTGEVHTVNAGYRVPRAEKEPLTIPKRDTPSGRTAMVGGFMAGAEVAHERFGELPWASLFDPAIHVATEGIIVDPVFAQFIRHREAVLSRRPETRAVFARADGELLTEGDLFRQPALAETLRAVARDGAHHMATGPWAKAFVEAVRAEGGHVTLEDLSGYEVLTPEPLQADYRGRTVFAPGPPTLGGVTTLEALNLVELARPEQHGHYAEDPDALYQLIQATRMSWLLTISPPAYVRLHFPAVDLDPRARVTEEHAERIWAKLRQPGWIQRFQGLPEPEAPGGHSDGVVVVDAAGNVAALTHSINTTLWGTTGIFVGGVSIPDSASFQQDRVAKAGPGGMVPNAMNPMIVLRDGEPVVASSCIGGGLHEASVQRLHSVLDHGWDPKRAVDAPIFLSPRWTADADGESRYHQQVIQQGTFAPELLDAVRERGQPLAVLPGLQAEHRGFWIGIEIDPETGRRRGAVDRNFNGIALAEPEARRGD